MPSGDEGLEERIEQHRQQLLRHIEGRFGGLEPERLLGRAEKDPETESEPSPLGEGQGAGRRRESREGPVVELLDRLIEEGASVCLSSEGGSGKTTSLRHLARNWARSYEPGGPVCVLAYLRAYDHDELLNFLTDEEAFPRGFDPCLTREDLNTLTRDGRLKLLLDGADECNTRDLVKDLTRFRSRREVAMVLGTRRSLRSDLFPWQVRIHPMPAECQEGLARQCLDDAQRGQVLLGRLRETPGGRQVAASPILLWTVCQMVRAGTSEVGVSEGRARLYRNFFRSLYDREHRERNREDLFPTEEREATAATLAKLFFEGLTDHRPPTRENAVAALRVIHGERASEGFASLSNGRCSRAADERRSPHGTRPSPSILLPSTLYGTPRWARP